MSLIQLQNIRVNTKELILELMLLVSRQTHLSSCDQRIARCQAFTDYRGTFTLSLMPGIIKYSIVQCGLAMHGPPWL